MVYSSDQGGSPNTAGVTAGDEGTGRTSTAMAAAAAAAGGSAAASTIPVPVLAWLNDDESGGSSDDDNVFSSSHRGKFASAAATLVRHSNRSAVGRFVPAFRCSSDRHGAVAAAAAAAAAAKMAVSTGGHTDPRGKEVGEGQTTDLLDHDPKEGNEEVAPSPASCATRGKKSPAEASVAAAVQGASAAQRQVPAANAAAIHSCPSGPGATSRTPFPLTGLRGLAIRGHKPESIGKGEAEDKGSGASRSWDGGEREMRSWLSQASDHDGDEKEEEEEEEEGTGRRAKSGEDHGKRSALALAGESEMRSWLSQASDDDDDDDEEEEEGMDGRAKNGKGGGRRLPLSKQGGEGPTTTRRELPAGTPAAVSNQGKSSLVTGDSNLRPRAAQGLLITHAQLHEDDEGATAASAGKAEPNRRQPPAYHRHRSRSRSWRRDDRTPAAAPPAAAASCGDGGDADDETDLRPEFIGLTVVGGRVVGNVDGGGGSGGVSTVAAAGGRITPPRWYRSRSPTPPSVAVAAVVKAAVAAESAAGGNGPGASRVRGGCVDGDDMQVKIAPPLLGKFQSLVLDNRDLAGLARCLPPDSGGRSPNAAGGSGMQSPVGGAAVAAGGSGGGGGDGRRSSVDAQQHQPQQQRERLRPDLLPLNVNDMNSGYCAGNAGSGGSGGAGGGGRDAGEHTQPLDSPSNISLFSFGSSTSMAEEDEVNDFLLECTDGESVPENGSVDGGHGNGNKFGALSKREIEDFFRDTSSSSSSSSSSYPSSSSSSPVPGQRRHHRHPNNWGTGEAGGTPSRDRGGSARDGAGEEGVVRAKKSHSNRHSSRHGGGSATGGGGDGSEHHHHSSRERLSPLPPHMRSLPKADQRFMRANLALRKGLGAVVGLNFDMLAPALQVKMMRPMSIARHKKGEVILTAGTNCRRFYVVLGAPRELLAVGEVPAVERSEGPAAATVAAAAAAAGAESSTGGVGGGCGAGSPPASRRGCRLLAGQYFGEKGLLRQAECTRKATVVAASTVVDVASIDIDDMAVWEPFRMFVLMKEVPLLANLPMLSLHALQQTLRHQTFSAGDYIVRQGEAGETFYMIVKGTVDVLETSIDPETGDERTKLLVQMFEGHYFGELALIYGEPRNASVRATEEVRCVCITKEDFRSCMNEKRFQEVLEEVAYQRAFYREQRAQQMEKEEEQQRGRRSHQLLFRSQSSLSPSSRSPGGGGREDTMTGRTTGHSRRGHTGGAGRGGPATGESGSVSPPQSRGSASSSSHSLRRSSFRETAKVVKRKLNNGTVIINKYRIVCELGRGSYGSVHLCRDGDTGKEYAMKVIDKRKRGMNMRSRQGGQGSHNHHLAETLRREVAVMKKLRHPNIVTLWEVIDDPKAQQLYMIQEYVEDGPLLPEGVVVPPMRTEEAREKFMGCIRGLHHLHLNGVVHGDIKPANLLVAKDGKVKIADFGAAVMLQNQPEGGEVSKTKGFNTLICTPAFTPPELFGASTTVSPACDVWALGVTLYQMVYGTLPFWPTSGNHSELEIMVTHRELSFPPTSGPSFAAAAAGGCGGTGIDGVSSNSSTVDDKGSKGVRTLSSSGLATLEAYDPMAGYLRNLLRRMLEKDPDHRISLPAAISHPWVTVEGSVRSEAFSITEEPGSSASGGVQVTDGELLDAWTIFPATPTPRGRDYSYPASSLSPATPRPAERPPKRSGEFFPTTSASQERYVYGGSRGGSPVQATWNPTPGRSGPTSRISPLASPATLWNQLTPTAMGNIAQFGWHSGHRSNSGYGTGDVDNIGGSGGDGGGGGKGSSHGSSSSNSSSKTTATTTNSETGNQRPAATASTIGAATIGAAMRAAALGVPPSEQYAAVQHRARSPSKLPVPAPESDNAPGDAVAAVGAEILAVFKDGTIARDGSGGVLTAGCGRQEGWGSPLRAVSPRAPSPDARAQFLSPVPVRTRLSPDLRIDVDHDGGGDGGPSSCESQSTPGIATSDGGFFCGPGGVIFPLRRQSSTSSVSFSGGSPIKLRHSGQLGASHSPGALGRAGAGAGAASVDAYSKAISVREAHGHGDAGRDRDLQHQQYQEQQEANKRQLCLQQPPVRNVASRRGTRGRGRRRRRPMERSMTFPGVAPVAVSGEEGEGQPVQAQDQEASFEALSTRPTEVTEISINRVVPSPSSTLAAAAARLGGAMAARDWGGQTPPRHPGSYGRQCWTGSRVGDGGDFYGNLVRGLSTGCLPSSTSSARTSGFAVTRPPPPSPGPGAGWNEEVETENKSVRQEVPADQARPNRAAFSGKGDVWQTIAGRCDGGGEEDGAVTPGGVGAGDGGSSCERQEASADQAEQNRAAFSRRNDFLVLSSKLARDSQGQTKIKARLCTTMAASCSFSLLRPARTSTLPLSSGRREEQARRSKPPLPLSPLASEPWSPQDIPEHPLATDRVEEEFRRAGLAASALPKVPLSTAVAAALQPPPPLNDARTSSSGRDSVLDNEVLRGEKEDKERKSGRSQCGGTGKRTKSATISGREAVATVTTVSEADQEFEMSQPHKQQQQQQHEHKHQSVQEEQNEEEEVSPNRVAARQLVRSFLASSDDNDEDPELSVKDADLDTDTSGDSASASVTGKESTQRLSASPAIDFSGYIGPMREPVSLNTRTAYDGGIECDEGGDHQGGRQSLPHSASATWRWRVSENGLRHCGAKGAFEVQARSGSVRSSSTGGIGGRAVYGLLRGNSSDSEVIDINDEECCEDWLGAVSVDPDSIDLALPPHASGVTEDLSLVGFQPLGLEEIPAEPVQARTWGEQVNLAVGVRYGHSAEIGSRRVMEDRTVAVSDIFRADATPSLRSRSAEVFPVLAAPVSPAPIRDLSASVANDGGDGDGDDRKRSLSASDPAAMRSLPAARRAMAGGGAAGSDGIGGGNSTGGSSRTATFEMAEGEVGTKEGGGSSELATVVESAIETSLSAHTSNDSGDGGAACESGVDGRPGSAKTVLTRPVGAKEVVTREARADGETGAGQGAAGCVERGAADEQQRPPLSAAFFGVYDGHDGDVVAEALQKSLHKLIAKQECFRDCVPEAIERGCYEMDIACLETQFRTLGRQCLCKIHSNKDADTASPSSLLGVAGAGQFVREAGDAAEVSPCVIACSGDCCGGSPESQSSWGSGAAEGGIGEQRPSWEVSNGSTDARSRLSGVATGMVGGATAVVAIATKVGEQTVIYTGNVGDCRAVLCRGGVAIDLTSDHRPSREDEKARVQEAGGYISRDRLNGVLGVTRAFGDIGFKEYPVSLGGNMWQGQQLTSQPETNSVPVHPDDAFLILACDGVWDLVSSQQVVSYVHRRLLKHRDVQRASRELCKTLGRMSGSDNCSCVIVCLNQVKMTPTVYSPGAMSRQHRHRHTLSLSDAQVRLASERGFSWSAAGLSSEQAALFT
eukprot:g8638.t3